VEAAVPIGLIINEMVTNSYKHAFSESNSGHIKVIITVTHPQMTVLVKDNGKGLPPDFDWQQQKTFGIKMIGTLVNKLKGTAEIYNDDGTSFVLTIPNYTNIS
jgi:two-component sensor histidine kinase